MSDRPQSLRARFAASELRGRALWVVIGCLVCQMGLGLTYVKSGLSADLIEALGMTRAQFSGANTPQLAVQSLASPLAGFLTVRYGAKVVLTASALLFAVVFVGFSQVESVAGFYFAIAGVGLGAAGMGDVSVGHVVAQWFRRHRGLALGIAYAGSNLGGSAMVWLTGAVAARSDFRMALLAVAVFSLVVLLPAAFFLVRDREATREELRGEQASAHTPAGTPPASPIPPAPVADETSLDLRAALRTRTFWILTTTLFAFFFYFNGILDHFVLILTDAGLSHEEAATRLSQTIGLGIVSKVVGGYLADRVSQERAILYDYGLLALSSVVLLFLPNAVVLPVFVLSYGFSQAARDVVWPLAVERCFGARHLGSIYGAMTLALLPGAALGPLAAAALRDALGDYRMAFVLFIALNAAALAALFFVRDERGGTTPGSPGIA
ncbi:MAG: MFS transporter [Deltaproteobacteria bacterium]|nr:MFS transporter [Deltaproteobacteria bacterium]